MAEPRIFTRTAAFRLSAIWQWATPGRHARHPTRVEWRALVVVAFFPPGLDLLLRLVHGGSSWRGLAWMTISVLSPDTQRVMDLYDRIASVSTETEQARVIARRTLAVVTVLLPQIIAVGAKLLHLK
jgi:hypothetical protein